MPSTGSVTVVDSVRVPSSPLYQAPRLEPRGQKIPPLSSLSGISELIGAISNFAGPISGLAYAASVWRWIPWLTSVVAFFRSFPERAPQRLAFYELGSRGRARVQNPDTRVCKALDIVCKRSPRAVGTTALCGWTVIDGRHPRTCSCGGFLTIVIVLCARTSLVRTVSLCRLLRFV